MNVQKLKAAGYEWIMREMLRKDKVIEQLEAKNNELMAKCGHQAISINELKRELRL